MGKTPFIKYLLCRIKLEVPCVKHKAIKMSVMSYIASKRTYLNSHLLKILNFLRLKPILWSITIAFTEFNSKEDHENVRLNNNILKVIAQLSFEQIIHISNVSSAYSVRFLRFPKLHNRLGQLGIISTSQMKNLKLGI